MVNTKIQLDVLSGPHAGTATQLTTDSNGHASFPLNRSGIGLDLIRFQFPVATGTSECMTRVSWRQEADLFTDGFEG